MNRIVFVTILSCVFLSTALFAQDSPQKPKTGPKLTATEPKPVAPSGASTTRPGGLPLRGYKFDVVTVNSSGTVTNRRKGQARYYVEDISGVALEMVEIPGGTFLMGNTEAGADQAKREYERYGHNPDQSRWEVPQHTVRVPTFYMGKFEVTQAQWRVVSRLPKVTKDLVSDPSNFKGDSLPVQQVSWEDAIEFCERLSRATGRTYRLPTEAQWEYAARGGTTTVFHFGDTITPELVNYDGTYPYGSAPKGTYRQTTTPVGSLGSPNPFGLYDMHGNVWEWCMDYWHESYDGAPTDGSSWETAGDTGRRVLRGGSYYHDANHCRAAMRVGVLAARGTASTGFRLVAVVQRGLGPSQNPPPEGPASYRVVNVMPVFWRFWDKAQKAELPEQIRLFREIVVGAHPELYTADVLNLDKSVPLDGALEERLTVFFGRVAGYITTMRRLSESLSTDLPKDERRFRDVFPDFRYTGTIYFLTSIGSFDGAWRSVAGQPGLVFGIDDIARVHGAEANLGVFFHHELFHVYHDLVQNMIASNAAPSRIYRSLWREGLAIYASKQLNPSAAEEEIFGRSPGMPRRARAVLPALAKEIRENLDSASRETYLNYFLGDSTRTDIPLRSGYYVGYLVAEKLAKNRTLSELARLSGPQLRQEIEQALREIEKPNGSGGA